MRVEAARPIAVVGSDQREPCDQHGREQSQPRSHNRYAHPGNASLPRMRRAGLLAATAVLLVGPAVLAFFSGGYFDGPRAVAAALAWALVLAPRGRRTAAAAAQPRPGGWRWPAWPDWRPGARSRCPGRRWSGRRSTACSGCCSTSPRCWPRVALLRDRRVARAVEPVLALGAVVAIGYGLVGPAAAGHRRPAPGALVRRRRPARAADHLLEREGLLAAIGLHPLRAPRPATRRGRLPMRVAAAAACAPLATGVYLSYSRGAIAVAVLGLVVLLAARPDLAAAARRGHRPGRRRSRRPRARPRCPASPR